MAIEWADGFETYGEDTSTTGPVSNANMIKGNYAQIGNDPSFSTYISSANKRTGSRSMFVNNYDSNVQFRRVFSRVLTTVTVGYAINLVTLPTADGRCSLFQFMRGDNLHLISVYLNPVGQIWVLRNDSSLSSPGFQGSGTTLGITSTPVISTSGWHYIECQVKHDAVTGYVTIKVDNRIVLDLQNIDTTNSLGVPTGTPSTGYAQFGLGNFINANASGNSAYIDDMYCTNTDGVNTGFLGDVQVHTLFPNGDTAVADWTPNSGTTLYNMIDETTPDGDTTTVTANAVSDAMEVDCQDLPADVVNVYGVIVSTMMKKDSAGGSGVIQGVDSGGTVGQSDEKSIGTDYAYYNEVFDKDPNTDSAWSRTSVNDAKLRLVRSL